MWPEAYKGRKQFFLCHPSVASQWTVMWTALVLIYFLHIHDPYGSPSSCYSSTSGIVQLHRIQQGVRHDCQSPSSRWGSQVRPCSCVVYGLAASGWSRASLMIPPRQARVPTNPQGIPTQCGLKAWFWGHPWVTALSSIQAPVWPRSEGTVKVHWKPAEPFQRSTGETEVKYPQSKLYYNFTLIFVLPFLPGVNN